MRIFRGVDRGLGVYRYKTFIFCPYHHLRRTIMSYYQPAQERGYLPLADHALIGNLRTAAMVSLDGSVESYCVPYFDSPSVFARILDKEKGGHFSIRPTIPYTSKQNYLPSSNVLQTKFMNDAGVVSVTDFLPRPLRASSTGLTHEKPLLPWLIRRVECIRGSLSVNVECAPAFNYARNPHATHIVDDDSVPLATKQKKALFESADITLDLRYVAETTASDVDTPVVHLTTLDLSAKGHKGLAIQAFINLVEGQAVTFILRNPPGSTNAYAKLASPASRAQMQLGPEISQGVVLSGSTGDNALVAAPQDAAIGRNMAPARPLEDPFLTKELIHSLLHTTNRYWYDWIRNSTYTGSWKEAVHRSALALKLLIFEPTGPFNFSSFPTTSVASLPANHVFDLPWSLAALVPIIDNTQFSDFRLTCAVVASPTFSLPEYIGGTRNWDYRYSWIRDSSFTLYALLRLGFTEEANAYLEFIFERLRNKNLDGSLQIMYTIHGDKDIPEIELTHMDGHKGSKPVRIGNGAADHKQMDIYGELMDCIYLGQKFGKPLSYDDWVLVRGVVDFVVEHAKEPDLSIWEVRNKERNFTYSKIMLWVAIDRGIVLSFPLPSLTRLFLKYLPLPGLRLADKRSLPCPNRFKWLATRDELYEEIMNNAWDKEGRFFGQSYEDTNVLDSAVLIMPLVFFMQASDPRFVSTLKQILKTPDKGGLTSNNLVYRYDTRKTEDGVGGEEGTFCLCTLWAISMFEVRCLYLRTIEEVVNQDLFLQDFLLYLNHVGLCTEEISDSGEALGNAVQGFTVITMIYKRLGPILLGTKLHFTPNPHIASGNIAVIAALRMSTPIPASVPFKEEKVDFTYGGETFQTYCKTYGDISDHSAGKRPLIVLHGGPGLVHNYLLTHSDLTAMHDIPVILYDQIGNGQSTHLKDKAPEFWTVDLFVAELDNVIKQLGIQDDFDLLGHSWGGMLAAEFEVRQQLPGLKHLVVTNASASFSLWIQSSLQLLQSFPEDVRDGVLGGMKYPEKYQVALEKFQAVHGCTIKPFPQEFSYSMGQIFGPDGDKTVASAPILHEWSIIDRLHLVRPPTLIINGRKDVAQDFTVQPFFDKIQKAHKFSCHFILVLHDFYASKTTSYHESVLHMIRTSMRVCQGTRQTRILVVKLICHMDWLQTVLMVLPAYNCPRTSCLPPHLRVDTRLITVTLPKTWQEIVDPETDWDPRHARVLLPGKLGSWPNMAANILPP
ncbi:hypothetical protein D9756_004515 [Leucocoprinus leucothites]|uniref:Uncharacterized protein n=1 Tax=Leucocoprinus leucothites TaxID=201217 RepID=A0A8H5LKW3_9AGAR|nr:hypothetical protein D9756_004515 [Leucoagaricus leucothites]